MKFVDLSKEERIDVLDRVSSEENIRQREVIEKDWWVTAVLRAMFFCHTPNTYLLRVAHH